MSKIPPLSVGGLCSFLLCCKTDETEETEEFIRDRNTSVFSANSTMTAATSIMGSEPIAARHEQPLLEPYSGYSFEAAKMCEAASRGDVEGVQHLVMESTTISINDTDEDGYPPLHRAVEAGHAHVSSLLLNLGANPNELNAQGQTALHMACKTGNTTIVEHLIRQGADVNQPIVDSYRTPLHIAVEQGHFQCVKRLVTNEANVNANANNAENREMPFHLACKLGHVQIVEYLHRHGSELELKDHQGLTGLMSACEHGHVETVQFLLSVGCNVNAFSDAVKYSPLHFATANGHLEIAEMLLQYGAIVDFQDYLGRTPLHKASSKGFPAIVKLLLDRGANMDIHDNGDLVGSVGRTPLDFASNSINYPRVKKVFSEAQRSQLTNTSHSRQQRKRNRHRDMQRRNIERLMAVSNNDHTEIQMGRSTLDTLYNTDHNNNNDEIIDYKNQHHISNMGRHGRVGPSGIEDVRAVVQNSEAESDTEDDDADRYYYDNIDENNRTLDKTQLLKSSNRISAGRTTNSRRRGKPIKNPKIPKKEERSLVSSTEPLGTNS
eukprot:gb/GECH01014789.1/.p1 GENE.gb/GECH01014789.1/~~gb/GECH01014789.1/.p1  ORF type:complete len:550 (+),score=136.98 gb/GECH01014789.1/:1-1650(+)